MEDGKLTGINYTTHSKLNRDCRVVIEECCMLPIPKSEVEQNDSNISTRRQSVRQLAQGRRVKHTKKTPLKKPKKKTKELPSNDNKQSAVVLEKTDQTPENELPISDNEIMELLNYIEYGGWSFPDLDIEQSSEDGIVKDVGEIQAQINFESECDESILSGVNVSCDQVLISTQNIFENQHSTSNDTDCQGEFTSTALNSNTLSETILTQSEFVDQCAASTQANIDNTLAVSTQTDLVNQYAASSQTDFDNQRPISTQTDSVKQCTASTQTDVDNQRAASNSTLYKEKAVTSTVVRKSFKRKKSFSSDASKPCQIFIHQLTNCSVNRKVFKCKTPNAETNDDDIIFVDTAVPKLTPTSNFESMKNKVVILLQRPCLKYLKQEQCGQHCRNNHRLPPAATVHETIKNWPSETIHFFYVTYIQRYIMCNVMYFHMICKAFTDRRLTGTILESVKDSERLCLESNLEIIFISLKQCGYTDDDALFEMCTNAYRTDRSINEVLKIISTLNVANFKRTIAFLSTEIESYDFDPAFGNVVLKQSCQMDTLDATLLEFCYGIIRKFYNLLNKQHMRQLLSKIQGVMQDFTSKV